MESSRSSAIAGGVSWVISHYALMLAVATAVYGRAADLAGIRLCRSWWGSA